MWLQGEISSGTLSSIARILSWSHSYGFPGAFLAPDFSLTTQYSTLSRYCPHHPPFIPPTTHHPDYSCSHPPCPPLLFSSPLLYPGHPIYFFIPWRFMSFLGSSLLPRFSGAKVYNLVILFFTSNVHLWLNTYHVCLCWSGLPHSELFYLISPICLQILLFYSLFCWAIIHCVDIPHFIYPIFSWGASTVFRFWLLCIMLLWTQLSKCPWGMVEHPLGMFPRVLLLDFEEDSSPIFRGTDILHSKVAVQVCTPNSSGVLLFLHILSNIDCH